MADSAVLQTSEKTKHEFHAEGFDGPLDLLLFLISENKINIYNIDVSLITEQFLQYIADHEAELDELADFYKMAADLLYIKSRMLLPVTTALDEEYEDPRQELVEEGEKLLEEKTVLGRTGWFSGGPLTGLEYQFRRLGIRAEDVKWDAAGGEYVVERDGQFYALEEDEDFYELKPLKGSKRNFEERN